MPLVAVGCTWNAHPMWLETLPFIITTRRSCRCELLLNVDQIVLTVLRESIGNKLRRTDWSLTIVPLSAIVSHIVTDALFAIHRHVSF